MSTVWKYDLPLWGEVDLVLPVHSEPIAVQARHGVPVLWVLVTGNPGRETRRFLVVGTGRPIGSPIWRHVGTVQLDGGALVLHVFEVAPEVDDGAG